jgi:Kef-type K+ transport system membrane component KefB
VKSLLTSPLTIFIAQALVIITFSRIIGVIARRFHQPMVIAEMVAGILLGPSLLGWLAPSVSHVLFPDHSLRLVSVFSQVGLILFMFLVGMELDPKLLRGRARASLIISHASIVVPFVLGIALSFYLYPRLTITPKPAFMPFALFVGAAMSITAFPVLARILSERGLTTSKVGSLAITCAAIDDLTAWCILAFVVALARSTGMVGAVRTALLAIAYAAFVLYVVRPLLRRLSERGLRSDGLSQNLFGIALVLLLVSAWLTEIIGVHALFGAFLMGVAIPKERGFAHALVEKIEDIVVVFLLPLFFAYSGLRTHIGLIDGAEPLFRFVLVLVVACVGKFGGATLAARFTGLGWRESSVIGVLMNTRGLMELVVLNIGLDLHVISPRLFTMMVVMALFTTFITSPILARIYPAGRLVDELASERDGRPAADPAFTVLACTAPSDDDGGALTALAAALAGPRAMPSGEGRVFALRLLPPPDSASVAFGAEQNDGAAIEKLVARGAELGVAVRPLSFVSTDPSRDICRVAATKGAGLCLVAWERPLLGSAGLSRTVREVLDQAPCDVGVLVDRGLGEIRRIAVHGSSASAAAQLGRRLARGTGAEMDNVEDAARAEGYDLTLIDLGSDGFDEAAARIIQTSDGYSGPSDKRTNGATSLLLVRPGAERGKLFTPSVLGDASDAALV